MHAVLAPRALTPFLTLMMAQNTALAHAASLLKRKNPPTPQERPSTVVKRTNTTKIYAHAPPGNLHTDTRAFLQESGFSDGDIVEKDSQDEEDECRGKDYDQEAEKISNDGQNEEYGESCDETEYDSYRSSSDDEGHQPRVIAGLKGLPRRQAKLPGFNKAMDPVLLKGLNAVKPFAAQCGETADAWASVVRYLKDDEDKERTRGREDQFALSTEYAAIAAKSLQDSGTIDARYIKLQEAYLCEQNCIDTKKAKRDRKHRAQSQAVLNEANGDHLLADSRIEPVRGRTVVKQEAALDQPTYEDPPLQFSAGISSGVESDTGQSSTTGSPFRPPRSPGMKKLALSVEVTDQLTLAAELMRDQKERNNQRLASLREEREKRRKAVEARIQREEGSSRDHFVSLGRQQDTIAKLLEAQLASIEHFVNQQIESTERLLLAIIQVAQRK